MAAAQSSHTPDVQFVNEAFRTLRPTPLLLRDGDRRSEHDHMTATRCGKSSGSLHPRFALHVVPVELAALVSATKA
ncbi:hypothetical protein Aglo01_10910 [Actinokineospora globicatena]|nr:hypothetical protein Aglo01_10910 [Actinokineospora globicatena]GLW83443.1 hypothetical protein Aglo02_10830 [Actinokineospora globicatena]